MGWARPWEAGRGGGDRCGQCSRAHRDGRAAPCCRTRAAVCRVRARADPDSPRPPRCRSLRAGRRPPWALDRHLAAARGGGQRARLDRLVARAPAAARPPHPPFPWTLRASFRVLRAGAAGACRTGGVAPSAPAGDWLAPPPPSARPSRHRRSPGLTPPRPQERPPYRPVPLRFVLCSLSAALECPHAISGSIAQAPETCGAPRHPQAAHGHGHERFQDRDRIRIPDAGGARPRARPRAPARPPSRHPPRRRDAWPGAAAVPQVRIARCKGM
jgi:hypothetical protein